MKELLIALGVLLCWHHALAVNPFMMEEHCHLFCGYGPILDAVQQSGLFQDSKHFVDMPLKTSKAIVAAAFEALPRDSSGNINHSDLWSFVHEHFSEPGTELQSCVPVNWTPLPEAFDSISNIHLKAWAIHLNRKWKSLCRKVRPEVRGNSAYTLIHVPRSFIIPGGRFRELYYWDSYWIMRGLLQTGLDEMAKGMILNLVSFVKRFGFVPNGGRSYYLRRSQPPVLTPMAYEYWLKTNDTQFLREIIPYLDIEHKFWLTHRRIGINGSNGRVHNVFRYAVHQGFPRPESYKEDIHTAQNFPEAEKSRVYADIASGCESGWDFSSRWFDHSLPFANLSSVQTSQILPVDLNAFVAWNQRLLAEIHGLLGHRASHLQYKALAKETEAVLNDVFWNAELGVWLDVDLTLGSHVKKFYASNLVPLFTGHADLSQTLSAVQYLKSTASIYPGGVPTSHVESSEQWDGSNGWSPLNHMIILGLDQSGVPEGQELAQELAKKWIKVNYFAFKKTRKMFEKYNVQDVLSPVGDGGEYEVQEGFGWTNGVVLDLIMKYHTILGDVTDESFLSVAKPEVLELNEPEKELNQGSSLFDGGVAGDSALGEAAGSLLISE